MEKNNEMHQIIERLNYHTQMRQLIERLNYYTQKYDEGNPVISDTEYDNLYFELMKWENETQIYFQDSPTQRINYSVVSELKKREHNHPMLSLDKTKDWNEFVRYFGDHAIVEMLKMDGLTCSLRYEGGYLVGAETRGNGFVGEDILHNALVVANIPNKIQHKEELVIDGEIICTYNNFNKNYSELYANPRNFAAGSIRLLDSSECAKRNLNFVAWNLIVGGTNSHIQNLEFLTSLGFTVVPWTTSFDLDAKEFLINEATRLSYPIDGLVGRFDDIAYGESLGSTTHHSRAAYAFKFEDETATTFLKDIEWTMGRTGVLTPVAVFDTIELEGSEVSRASMHNVSVMRDLCHGDPFVDQQIHIFKANMIIPQVKSAEDLTGFLHYPDLPFINIPDTCPICGEPTKLVTENNSTVLKCNNSNCEGKLINRLDHFAGKKGLDIKGLSKATLEKLIDWEWVNSNKSLFELSSYSSEWMKKPGFGPKSVQNILDAIDSSRHCELHQFIAALGIPLIGSTASKELCKYFTTWYEFIQAIENEYKFYNLPSFGVEMHSSLIHFDYTEAKEIADKYIIFKESAAAGSADLNGQVFVITGSVKKFKNRDELKSYIESKGGKVTGSVSKNTTYLINNDANSTSSKNVSAQKLGIPIISEEKFLEMFDK